MGDDKINFEDLDLFADQDETYEVVTVTDDDGTEQDYYIIDGIVDNDTRYILLVKTEDFDLDEPEAFILKEVEINEDECTYEPVEDEEEYNRVILLFQDEDSEYEMKF
mgnify:CR=1 FL=1